MTAAKNYKKLASLIAVLFLCLNRVVEYERRIGFNMDWKENDEWKIVFPERRLFLMKHHNWAFIAWELAIENGWIEKDATLFHVDQHLDEAMDGAKVAGLLEAKGSKDLFQLTKCEYGSDQFVGTDNFIWAGFARESIQLVVSVSPEEPDDFLNNEELKMDLDGFVSTDRVDKQWFTRLESISDLQFYKDRNILPRSINNKKIILDLDLDYFAYETTNQYGHTIYVLKDEKVIKEELALLKKLLPWDVITVAISPEDWHIGGEDNADLVLNLFLKEFDLNLCDGKDWSVLETK